MRKLLLITILLMSTNCYSSSMRLVSEVNYHKQVNDNSGLELLLKTSIPLSDDITIKLGVSEGYTAPRATPFMFNHAGLRGDIGVYWSLFNGFQVGYTHSARRWFSGAKPKDVYDYDSVDTLSIRKEFGLW